MYALTDVKNLYMSYMVEYWSSYAVGTVLINDYICFKRIIKLFFASFNDIPA